MKENKYFIAALAFVAAGILAAATKDYTGLWHISTMTWISLVAFFVVKDLKNK